MILEPKEVTQDKLVEILKNAAFDIEVQESGIYIKDTSFPIWLNIDNKKQKLKNDFTIGCCICKFQCSASTTLFLFLQFKNLLSANNST